MAINSTTTTTTTVYNHPAGATALSTPELYAEARTTTTATPLTPALQTMLPTLVQQGTQGSAASSVFSYTPQQRYESVAVAPAAALAIPMATPSGAAMVTIGTLVIGALAHLATAPRTQHSAIQAKLMEDIRQTFSQVPGQTAAATNAVMTQVSQAFDKLKTDFGAGMAALTALAQQLARGQLPLQTVAPAARTRSPSTSPATPTVFSAATIQRLQQMLPTTGVQAALQAAGIQVNKPAAALNTLQAQAAQYNALQQLRRSPDWPALSARLAPELASLQTSLQKTMTALSAQATSRMEAAATLLHLGRALTAPELNQLKTIHADLMRLQSQITAAYTPLQRAGLYENPQNPTVFQIKKQLGAIGRALGGALNKAKDAYAKNRRAAEQKTKAAGLQKLESEGSLTVKPSNNNPFNSISEPLGSWYKKLRENSLPILLGLWGVNQLAKRAASERAQNISAQQSSSLVQQAPVPEVVPEFQIFLDQKNQLKNLDRQLVNNDVFAAGIRNSVDLSRPITQEERKRIDNIYAYLADSRTPFEEKTKKSEELKVIVFRGLSLIQGYMNKPRNGSVGVKPEQLAHIDIKTAPPNDLARARFLRADSNQARRALENHYNNHLLFFKMQTAAMLTPNILRSGDYTSLSQWQRIFMDSAAESPNVVTQSDWHKRVTEGQGAQAIQNAQRIAMEGFDSLVGSVTQQDRVLLGIPPDGDASPQERKAYGARLRLLANLFGRVGSNAIDSLQNASTANSRALQDQIGGELGLQSDQKGRTQNAFLNRYQPYQPGGEYSKYPTEDSSKWVSIKMGRYTFVLPYTVASNAIERRNHIRNIEAIVQEFSSNDIPLGPAGEVRSKVEQKIRELRSAASSSGEPISQGGGSGASTGSDFTGEPLPLESGSGGDGTRAINPVETN